MGMGIAIALLKKFWPFLVGALIIGGTLTYVKVLKAERDHYKSKVMEVQLKLDKLVIDNKVAVSKLEQSNKDLTERMTYAVDQSYHWYEERNKEYAAKVKANKELARVKLDLESVRLFNSTKSDTTTKSADTTTAKPGNDGEATTTEEVTLTDIFIVSGENDTNHLKCIAIVEQWQAFWLGYVENVKHAQEP